MPIGHWFQEGHMANLLEIKQVYERLNHVQLTCSLKHHSTNDYITFYFLVLNHNLMCYSVHNIKLTLATSFSGIPLSRA